MSKVSHDSRAGVKQEPTKYIKFKDGLHDYETQYVGTRLLPMEELNQDSIETITFYEKEEKSSFDETINYIKNRFSEIVDANPWLLWFIVNHKKSKETANFEKGIYFEQVIGQQPTSDDVFKIEENNQIFDQISYKQLCRITRNHRVGAPTFKCDSNSHAVKYVIYHNADKTKIAVYCSISHMIVDGCGSYTIWNMFSPERKVATLNPKRDMNYETRMATETSMVPVFDYFNPMELVPMFFRNIYKALRPKKFGKPKVNSFLLSNDEISRRKSCNEIPSPPGFLSSNDIINNWYMAEMGTVNWLEMGVNCRDRVSGITDNMAGNYLNAILLDKEDLSSPANHRARLSKVLKGEGMCDIPSVNKFWYGYKALSTNWATFYKRNDLPGFKETLHHPIIDFEAFKILGTTQSSEDFMIIFRPREDEIGILCLPYTDNGPKTSEDYLNHNMVVGRILPQKSDIRISYRKGDKMIEEKTKNA